MLSKFYRAAKSASAFLSPQEENKQLTSPDTPSNMVTTRRQSGAIPDDESITPSPAASVGSAAGGARKRRRNEPALAITEEDESEVATPVATSKRQKKLPVRARVEDNDTPRGTPTGRLTRAMRAAGMTSPKSSPQAKKTGDEATETEDETAESEVSESEAEVFVTPAQHLIASPQKKTPLSATPVPKHKRFGSEDPVEVVLEEPKEEKVAEDEEEEESSDDDAPEVVMTSSAAQKVKDAARDAAKARKQEEEVERQKRRERDARLKEQVQASNKRQKVDKAADDESTTEVGDAEPAQKKTLDTNDLPEFLPMEYLKDPVEAVEAPVVSLLETKSKKTKFTDEVDVAPRDKKVGNTTFTVAHQSRTEFLAPKAAKLARSLKEDWINARGMGGLNGGTPRVPASKGFFVRR